MPDPRVVSGKGLPLKLRDFPRRHGYRFGDTAKRALLDTLFDSLAGEDPSYLALFFPNGKTPKNETLSLSNAQGAVDGAEYTEAARGKSCGHIFRAEEPTYSCKTCTADDTCVLCAKCFEASDHEGHQVFVSFSEGSSGCCDCGDPEAWNRPINCSIHAPLEALEDGPKGKQKAVPPASLPLELQDCIRLTISRAMDYVCDVFACSPEYMRLIKQEELIRRNEAGSRLNTSAYGSRDDLERHDEYALILWNDEKHTVPEVQDQVARACRRQKRYGHKKAMEIDAVGRSIIDTSTDIQELLRKAKILEQINVTVTIRSTRDTFREDMCGTIVEWFTDIAGCSVGNDGNILMNTICEEMLKPWNIGSHAINLSIAKHGISDQQKSDDRLRQLSLQNRVLAAQAATRNARVQLQMAVGDPLERAIFGRAPQADEDTDGDDEDDEDGEETEEEVVIHEDDNNNDEMELDQALTEADLTEAANEAIDGNAVIVDDGLVELLSSHPSSNHDQAGHTQRHQTSDAVDAGSLNEDPQNNPNELLSLRQNVRRSTRESKTSAPLAPAYWCSFEKSMQNTPPQSTPIEEDLTTRVRIDFLILYDLRMWKTLRNELKHLYISTVVRIQRFKRILSLRFAAVYTYLAELYLVADREPERSVIGLSLQMLTTPSITAEIVERGNFLTKLLAILYTFLTKREVGGPEEVDLAAHLAFDAGVMTNRRIHHFFNDMKYLLESSHVQHQIRRNDEHLLQFLDFIKLFQGICPNVRAVGEHVEYENDSFMSAGYLVRDITRMTHQFCRAFTWTKFEDASSITRAIRHTAKVTIVNSLGVEHKRSEDSRMTKETKFKSLEPFPFEQATREFQAPTRLIVDFTVEKEAMSFHHVLHNALSWLIDCGKSMSVDQLRSLLEFTPTQLAMQDWRSSYKPHVPQRDAVQYLLALFDVPLHVCAWIVQMKAGMWVRNGLMLRHQMSNFRGTLQRDVTAQRDTFLLQVAFSTLPPDLFLASAIDRFGMSDWMRGRYSVREGWEDHQMVDVAEDFIHLLCIVLSDRALLRPLEEEVSPDILVAKQEIAHALCFKPLPHSDLCEKLTTRVLDMDELDSILNEVAKFKPPDGLQDSGTFELRKEYFDLVDPFNAYYTKNQREEAEHAWRQRKAQTLGISVDRVVFEPTLPSIKSGVFSQLGSFTQTPLFAQIIFASLNLAASPSLLSEIPSTRFETFLVPVLHLMMLAILEDRGYGVVVQPQKSFVDAALDTRGTVGLRSGWTILRLLISFLKSDGVHENNKPKIRHIVQRFHEKRPALFEASFAGLPQDLQDVKLGPAVSDKSEDVIRKKQQAQERQARVLAAFKQQQSDFLQHQNVTLSPNDWSDLESNLGDDSGSVNKTWSYPRDTCIFCQEETDDQRLYGTLSHITESRIFRVTDLQNQNHIEEVQETPLSYDRSADSIRPFGFAGKNVEQISKTTADGSVLISERRGLGRGWSPSQTMSGPVMTGCGHIMHYSCFETFSAATERRQSMQMMRNHPERMQLNEFVCPLCKALGNAFLPIMWKPREISPSKTLSDAQFDQWITAQVPFLVSRVSELPSYQMGYANHAKDSLQPGYSARLIPALEKSGAPDPASRFHLSMPAFLSRQSANINTRDSDTESRHEPQEMAASELIKAYKRLQETMKNNGMWSNFPTASKSSSGGLSNSDILARLLGYSLTGVEILNRGVDASDATTFLDKIPEQTMSHLKILSETCSTYLAISGLQSPSRIEAPCSVRQQVTQLFGYSPEIDQTRRSVHLNHDSNELYRVNHNTSFGGRDSSTFTDESPMFTPEAIAPLLYADIFPFLVECSVYVVPYLHLDIHHVLRLCYLAEIVKVTVAFLTNPEASLKHVQNDQDSSMTSPPLSSNETETFSAFVQSILDHISDASGSSPGPSDTNLSNPNQRYPFDQFLRQAVTKYALTFLRKSLLLLHVRSNFDFTAALPASNDKSELDRLCKTMHLPTVDEMTASLRINNPSSASLHNVISHWISHWTLHHAAGRGKFHFRRKFQPASAPPPSLTRSSSNPIPGSFPDPAPRRNAIPNPSHDDPDLHHPLPPTANHPNPAPHQTPANDTTLPLPHPGIYELVALPQTQDILNTAAMSRRCPSSPASAPREMSDPCLCLLCGALFCGQAQCCAEGGRGGAAVHAPRCGGSVGMVFNIRRNTVLMLDGRNGSYFAAPYLDVHGETDWGLKRRRQLFLSERRYERLFREVWLAHGVPSAISRRLEGESNNGGWETN